MIGLCSLVLESELTQDQRDCLTTVIKSGETLLCIINDILLFSKLESGELLIEQLPFNPMNAVEDVLDVFALLAQQQENELISHFKPGIACPAYGDVMRLRQVLTNLVSNALKFSKKGSEVIVTVEPYQPTPDELILPTPTVNIDRSMARLSPHSGHDRECSSAIGNVLDDSTSSIRRRSSDQSSQSPLSSPIDDGTTYLKFSVQDFGLGIPKSKQHRLFHAFSQVDASDTRKYGQ